MADAPLLELREVHKAFGGLAALTGVSMTVDAGQVYGLIGPNGSGKTTLFNVITGFVRADHGAVRFMGERVDGLTPDRIARKGLCRTFQGARNPQAMTVMENMLLAPQGQRGESVIHALARPRRVRAQEAAHEAGAWELLRLVKLDHQADTLAGNLSGGQKKLLMLAQVLMLEPKLILLDEPVAGVNPRLIDDIVEVIRTLRRRGQNFLIIEHNMGVVRRLCDTVYVLDGGSVLASGPTAATLQREDVLRAYLARQTRAAEAEG